MEIIPFLPLWVIIPAAIYLCSGAVCFFVERGNRWYWQVAGVLLQLASIAVIAPTILSLAQRFIIATVEAAAPDTAQSILPENQG